MMNRRKKDFKGESVGRTVKLILFLTFLFFLYGCSEKENSGKNPYTLNEAVRLKETGRYDSSISVYGKLISRLDSTKECSTLNKYRIEIADLYRLLGEFKIAKTLINKIDTVNCTDADVKLNYHLLTGKLGYDTRNYKAALEQFEKALGISNKFYGSKSLRSADCLISIGKCNLSLNNYPGAEKYFTLSFSIKKELNSEKTLLIPDYINFGLYYLALGNYDESLKNFNLALSLIPDSRTDASQQNADKYLLDKASVLNGIGIVYYQMSELDKALKNMNDALRIRELILNHSHYLTADIYGNIGMVYVSYAEPEIASDLYDKALNIRIKVFGEKHITVGRTYNNLANVYKDMGKLDKAELYFRKAIDILGALSPGNLDLGIILGNLGDTEARNKEFSESIKHFTESIKILKKYFGELHPYVAITIDNLGLAYAGMGNLNDAVKNHNLAYSIAKKLYPGKSNILFSQILDELGQIKEIRKDYNGALKLYQKSVSNIYRDVDENNYQVNPAEGDLKRDMVALETLSLKANVLYELYRQSGKKQLLDLSVDTYNLVDKTVDMIRSGFKEESSRLLLSGETYRIFNNAIRTFSDAYNMDKSQSKQFWFDKAFLFCEKSKALDLLQTLIDIKAKDFGGIPNSLLQKEHNLQYRLSMLEANLFDEQSKGSAADRTQVMAFQNSIFDLKKEYYSLIENFEKNYPRYYSLKYQLKPVSAESIQKKILKDNDVIVEYFLGKERLFIFIISRKQCDLKSLEVKDPLTDLVNGFRNGLRSNDYIEYSTNAYKLYQVLIKPVEDLIKGMNLIIIPDGVLNYLPYDALISSPPDTDIIDYRKLHYLINDYKISYGYSASLLWENIVRSKTGETNSFVGFAPY